MKAMRSPGFLTAVVLLQAGLIAGLIADSMLGVGMLRSTHAQLIPDPAAQVIQTNEILRTIDGRLARIQSTLEGELKVRMADPAAAPPARPTITPAPRR